MFVLFLPSTISRRLAYTKDIYFSIDCTGGICFIPGDATWEGVMQTLEVVRLVREIQVIVSSTSKAFQEFQQSLFHGPEAKVSSTPDAFKSGLRFTGEFSVACSVLRQSSQYTEVLKAFGFPELLNPEMAAKLVASAIIGTEGKGRGEQIAMASVLFRNFSVLMSFVGPLATLTSPPEITEAKFAPEVATVEIEHQVGRPFPAELAASVMNDFVALYDALVQIKKDQSFPKLCLINVDGGSSFRFDFKGAAEIIREVKDLIIEVWLMIRNSKPDKIIAGNRVAMETLQSIGDIRQMHADGKLSPEETENVCRVLYDRSLSFLTKGARIGEIRETETINNKLLLSGFQQRLLPAPETTGEATQPPTKAKKRKRAESPDKSAD